MLELAPPMVLFRLRDDAEGNVRVRPAIVTQAHSRTCLNLQVILDGHADSDIDASGQLAHYTSVGYGPNPGEFTGSFDEFRELLEEATRAAEAKVVADRAATAKVAAKSEAEAAAARSSAAKALAEEKAAQAQAAAAVAVLEQKAAVAAATEEARAAAEEKAAAAKLEAPDEDEEPAEPDPSE